MGRDAALLEKITKSLSITIPSHVLRSRELRNRLTSIFSAWLPLSTALLVSIIEKLPAPPAAQASRMPTVTGSLPGASSVDPKLKEAMINFTSSDCSPTVAYISKMITVADDCIVKKRQIKAKLPSAEEAQHLARIRREEIRRREVSSRGFASDGESICRTPSIDDENQPERDDVLREHLVGFARLYSGRLKVGDYVYVLSPKYNAALASSMLEPQRAQISSLYLLMGRELEPLDSVPAGVIFGVGGLENHVQKSATLCSQNRGAINLAGISKDSPPILRAALEPADPRNLQRMMNGLRILEQSDPCATYEVLESGEHVMLTAGELHLERCLKDLREKFARCDIQVGEPTVPYRESIVSTADMNPLKDNGSPQGSVIATTPSGKFKLHIQIYPLPVQITEFLRRNSSTLKTLYSRRKLGMDISSSFEEDKTVDNLVKDEDDDATINLTPKEFLDLYNDFRSKLSDVMSGLENNRSLWLDAIGKIVAFGPKRIGSNILIDSTSDGIFADM